MSGIKLSLEFLQEAFNGSKDTKEAVSKAYSTYNAIREAVIVMENKFKKEENNKATEKVIDLDDIKKNTESIVIRKIEDIGKVEHKREDKGER